MHRQTRLVLVAVTVVAVAGCSAGPFGAPAPETTDTVTPVPVHDTATSSDTSKTPLSATALPPGIHPNGSVDLDRVVHAHNEYLLNRSFAIRYSGRRGVSGSGSGSGEDGERSNVSVRILIENETNYHFRYLNETGALEDEVYGDESGRYSRSFADGRTHVRVVDSGPTPVRWRFTPTIFRLGQESPFLSPGTVSVSTVRRGGEELYRIFVPSTPDGLGLSGESNYSATLYVTDDGLIRTMHVEYDRVEGDDDGDRTSLQMRYSFGAVGETTVERPVWVTEAVRDDEVTEVEGDDRVTEAEGDDRVTEAEGDDRTARTPETDAPTTE